LGELLRWWGVTVAKVMRPIVAELGDAVTEVEVGGVRALVRSDDLEEIASTRPAEKAVHLVGGFDPLIVGAGLREQLLPPAHLKRVSRTAGWISPVVLSGGTAAGVWDSRRTATGLSIVIEPFGRPTAAHREAMEAAAERIGEALALPVTVAFGAVFPAISPPGRRSPPPARG
jgi:hypothetical protein